MIIQSTGGVDGANRALKWLSKASNGGWDHHDNDTDPLKLVGAVSLSLPAKWVDEAQQVPGLIVTPDALVQVSGGIVPTVLSKVTSTQLWPYESGNANLWPGDLSSYAGKAPAIAIVDSGIQNRSDFGNRVVASVNLSTIPGNTANDAGALDDKRGHGTFVAGIAAGAAPDLAGAAPGAPLVSIKVMNDQGMAKTSDVIAACQWILDNKDKYNIRVANFSLHSGYSTNFYRDPLDQAVEKLWFNNVVVVAAAGNYGTSNGPSGVLYAPGNDPFVITVGAVDLGTSPRAYDDTRRPVLGLRLHAGRLLQAGRRGAGPLHGRPDPGRLDDHAVEGREHGRHRPDPALGHVVRGAGRRGHRGEHARAAPELVAGPGEGRPHAHGPRRSQREPEGRRPRRDHGHAAR